MSLISAGVIELTKDNFPCLNNAILKVMCEVVVGALYLLGGILWNRETDNKKKIKRIGNKFFACILFLLPPVFVIIDKWNGIYTFREKAVYIPAGLLLGTFLLIIFFARLVKD